MRDAEEGAPSEGASAAVPAREATLELSMPLSELRALARLAGLTRRGTTRPVNLVWHDDGDSSLAEAGVSLVRDGKLWRMERLRPGDDADWPATAPTPVLGEAASPSQLHPAPPFDAAPVASFAGRHRIYVLHGAELGLLYGSIASTAGPKTAVRLSLCGPSGHLPTAADLLATGLTLAVPRATLALEAMALAKSRPIPARHLGAPEVQGGLAVTDGLAAVLGHLLDALLHWVDQFRAAPDPEAVHQARVATRRLRSALSIYKRVAACPELERLNRALKDAATRLGAARDWDVFLEGTGERLRREQPDPRTTLLVRTAQRRRNEAYAELRTYLANQPFRLLELELGCAVALRPWEATAAAAELQQDTVQFAATVLERRFKKVRKGGRGITELPTAALHELRKDCKRLRYAAEFFAPGFPKKRAKAFGKRLAALQEELGALNDTVVSGALLGQLGRAGRGYAGGVVQGWGSAAAEPARARIGKAWRRFRAESPFWQV